MKTPMKHIETIAEPADHLSGRASIGMIVVYVILFGGWLALQLHK